MSIETTIAQAAARDAEAEWNRHRKTCSTCGDKRRGARGRCSRGAGLAVQARDLRQAARESKAADSQPSASDVPLFDVAELGGPWHVKTTCGHQNTTENPPRVDSYLSCPKCQSQRKVISVTAGQKGAG